MSAQGLKLQSVAKPKSLASWADIRDDGAYDDEISDSSSWLDGSSSVQSSNGNKAEKAAAMRLRNRPLTKLEAVISGAAMQSPSWDSTSESSLTGSSPTERSAGSFPEGFEGSAKFDLEVQLPTGLDGDGEDGHIGVSSLGSAAHDIGHCKPCLFVHTHVGCSNGSSCEFCHLEHKRKNKPRPCKGKRDRYRKLLLRMMDGVDGNPDAAEIVCAPEAFPRAPIKF